MSLVTKRTEDETASSSYAPAIGWDVPADKPDRRESLIPMTAKIGRYLCPLMLLVIDYLAILAALLTAFHLRDTILPDHFALPQDFYIPAGYIYFIVPLIYIGLLLYERMYTRRLPFWKKTEQLFKISVYATVLTIGILYFSHTAGNISRIFVALSGVVCFIYLALARFITKRILAKTGLWQKPVVLVGAGKTAELLAKAFKEDPNMGYKIVGVIEDNHLRPMLQEYPLLGRFTDAEEIIKTSGVQDVVIAAPGLNRDKLLQLVYRIQPHVAHLAVVPDLFEMPMSNLDVEALFNQKTILLRMRNNLKSVFNRFFKYSFDLIASTIGLILISPIMLLISVLIFIDSPGPVIFAHRRVGAKGKEFKCYKFRTMVTNSQEVLEKYLAECAAAREEWEQDFKLKDDPRITRVGKFLRKTSLDELPQLFNIIKGEMSLVGPRPIVEEEIPKYKEFINDYYLVRPGLTGFWQVNGRSDVDYDTRVQMDSWYVRNWSFWLDMSLLLRTVKVVLDKKGAY